MDVGGRDRMMRALILLAALLLFVGTAGARPVTLQGPACTRYETARRGNDLVITCPGPLRFYTPAPPSPSVIVRDWYSICGYHAMIGGTVYCVAPIKRKP